MNEFLKTGNLRSLYEKKKKESFGFILFIAVMLLILGIYTAYIGGSMQKREYEPSALSECVILLGAIFIAGSVLTFVYSFSNKLKTFICAHCLKTIETDKLHFSCPFCNKEHKADMDVLFSKCSCGSKIQFVECYYCKNPIDLFASYDENKIEGKRYV